MKFVLRKSGSVTEWNYYLNRNNYNRFSTIEFYLYSVKKITIIIFYVANGNRNVNEKLIFGTCRFLLKRLNFSNTNEYDFFIVDDLRKKLGRNNSKLQNFLLFYYYFFLTYLINANDMNLYFTIISYF